MEMYRSKGNHGIYVARAFGWQLDYRPDGWLPFSVRNGHQKWHVLRLGRLGCITLWRLWKPSEVTVTLNLDMPRWNEGMQRAARLVNELSMGMNESARIAAYQYRISCERAIGRMYIKQLMADWRAELGMDEGGDQ